MKAWIFKLESVRAHKAQIEERAASQVAAALKKLGEAITGVRAVREQIRRSIELYGLEPNSVQELAQFSDYHRKMQELLKEALLVQDTAESNLARARTSWTIARQKKEAIEKLRERSRAQHEKGLRGEEQKTMDESRRPALEVVEV